MTTCDEKHELAAALRGGGWGLFAFLNVSNLDSWCRRRTPVGGLHLPAGDMLLPV